LNQRFLSGVKSAAPVMMGYLPVGIAFGVLASKSGLSLSQIMLMSTFVYAGSSQFIAVDMWASGASVPAIVATTFLVNLRHLLMSASIGVHYREYSLRVLPALSFCLTDETFALGITRLRSDNPGQHYFLGIGISSYLFWVASTVFGGALGDLITDTQRWGLDFVLPAMFIALLMMQINRRLAVFALISGALSLVFAVHTHGNWNVILATVITATIGVLSEKWTRAI
jgi:4-azaleucine resistance transporter AzlC